MSALLKVRIHITSIWFEVTIVYQGPAWLTPHRDNLTATNSEDLVIF